MSSESRLLVAVDLGSSSVKVRAADVEGDGTVRWQSRRSIPHRPVRRDGALVWDVERIVLEVIAEERSAHPSLEITTAIDAWGSDFALIGADGHRVGPLRSYRDPAFVVGYARARSRGFDEYLREKNGCAVGRDSTLSQLLTLLAEDPGLRQRELTFLPLADYLGARLSGVVSAGSSPMSTTGLLDPRTGAVDRTALDRMGIPERWFLEPAREENVVGTLERVGAGCARGLLAKVAGHDTAAALHAGFPGGVFLSLGSWAVTGAVVDERRRVSAPFSVPGMQHELCSDGSLRVNRNVPGMRILQNLETEWFGGPAAPEQREALLRGAREPSAPGGFEAAELDALPPGRLDVWLEAEARSRGIDASTRSRRYRLAMEAIASGVADAVRALESAGLVRGRGLWVCGGGIRNAALLECIARSTGRRLEIGPSDASAEGGLRGLARVLGIGELDFENTLGTGEPGT